jgi:NAD(P)-dependent dehydrogenase (short-subunit alcohol dehydrogenase family)
MLAETMAKPKPAAQGIGRCLARHFLQLGHKVFILDFAEEELKHTALVHLKEYTDAGRLGHMLCNLREKEEIRTAAQKAVEFFSDGKDEESGDGNGRIHVLINNGGISNPYWKDGATMEDPATSEQWQAYVETNLSAPFLLSQAVLPYMKVSAVYEERKRQNAGHPSPCIIHVSSFRMLRSDPNQEGYASTKAGLQGLTHSMAVSLSQIGIRVNLIAPGRIKVAHECKEGDEKGLTWDIDEDDREKHATNRAGKPEDIATCAEWLIGAGFVTGQSITVDGGASIIKNQA